MSVMILVAGVPASGKTTFAKYLSSQLKIPMASKDIIKEYLYDSIGFKIREEKVALSVAAVNIMYHFAEVHLSINQPVILENNFENITKPKAEELTDKYKCRTITVLFHGDIEVIYKRFCERNKSPERHRGHIVNTQYPETDPKDYQAKTEINLQKFYTGIKERGMIDFNPGGEIITADTTDFSKVSYEKILNQIKEILKK